MAEFPSLPLFTDAYLGDTTHLTTIEHGAYLLLLITSWRTRDTCLPDDDRLLARYTRTTAAQWRRLRPVLAEFFEIEDGVWKQPRLIDEANAVRQHRERMAENGRASALKRKGRHSTKRQQSDNGASTPIPNTVTNVTGAEAPPDDPVKQIFEVGVTLLTSTGTKDRQARSLIGKWRKQKGDAWTLQALLDAKAKSISAPVEWIEKRAASEAAGPEAALASGRATADRYRRMGMVDPTAGSGRNSIQ